eukprot:scaffold10659_cov36-Prasinocladus_malaysianus.AAC.2
MNFVRTSAVVMNFVRTNTRNTRWATTITSTTLISAPAAHGETGDGRVNNDDYFGYPARREAYELASPQRL